MLPEDHHSQLDRRSFVKSSLVPAAWAFAAGGTLSPDWTDASATEPDSKRPAIIDTNVHLFEWPFRALKYARTDALVQKLRRHRITVAWAGSFEAVLRKQLDHVNRRLAEECSNRGDGLLVPVGSVNPVWPGWEEDLRRCHVQYRMPGIRLYPAYHGYTLDEPEFVRLLAQADRRGLFVQIAMRMEDERVHHPSITVPTVPAAPLTEVLKKVPTARVQLLNSGQALQGSHVSALLRETSVTFDISHIEGIGGGGRLVHGTHPSYRGPVPIDRLMFGSHAPYFPCESALLKLFESPFRLEQLENLMHANARRLWQPA